SRSTRRNSMSQDLSRRGFLAGLSAGGTTLALAPAAGAARTALAPTPLAAAPEGIVQAVHPLAELKPDSTPIRVLVAAKLTAEELEQIRKAAPGVELMTAKDPAERHAAAATAEVILGEPDPETIRAAPGLKWVQHWAAGVERLPRELMEHPCVLTNMQRVF